MSLIKPKQQKIPFRGTLAPQQPPAVGVGNTYGERRVKGHQAALPSAETPVQKPVDQFTRAPQRQGDLSSFIANATYKAARRFTNVPYKLSRQHLVEEGLAYRNAPVEKVVKKPSDLAILNFLNKIIDTSEFHSQANMRRAAFQGSPVQPQRPAVQRTAQVAKKIGNS